MEQEPQPVLVCPGGQQRRPPSSGEPFGGEPPEGHRRQRRPCACRKDAHRVTRPGPQTPDFFAAPVGLGPVFFGDFSGSLRTAFGPNGG